MIQPSKKLGFHQIDIVISLDWSCCMCKYLYPSMLGSCL